MITFSCFAGSLDIFPLRFVLFWVRPGVPFGAGLGLPRRRHGMPRKAVIIGKRYADGINCHAGAQAIKAALIRVASVAEDNITFLLNPTLADVRQAFHSAATSSEDMFTCFFSGHSRASAFGPSSLVLGDGVPDLTGAELGALLASVVSTNKLVILDMCFAAGAVGVPFGDVSDDSLAIMSACRSNRTALGPGANGLSLYTNLLVRGLMTPSRTWRDECITPDSLHSFVIAEYAGQPERHPELVCRTVARRWRIGVARAPTAAPEPTSQARAVSEDASQQAAASPDGSHTVSRAAVEATLTGAISAAKTTAAKEIVLKQGVMRQGYLLFVRVVAG